VDLFTSLFILNKIGCPWQAILELFSSEVPERAGGWSETASGVSRLAHKGAVVIM